MAANTKIEWCDHTFNPWVGCTKISPACDHCYAEGWAKRAGTPELWQGERRRTSPANWRQPVKWNAAAAAAGKRARVFCASLADVFDNQVPPEWRADLWRLIEATPHLDWLLLTKRPQNIARMLPEGWGAGWPNVWLGTTVENQNQANIRIPHLLNTPARVRFLSCEPLLEPVDLDDIRPAGGPLAGDPFPLTGRMIWASARGFEDSINANAGRTGKVHWVIAGGESGAGARPMHPEWARQLRDQCRRAGTAFLFKQWGEWMPVGDVLAAGIGKFSRRPVDALMWLKGWQDYDPDCDGVRIDAVLRVGKAKAGRLLDGVQHDGFPA